MAKASVNNNRTDPYKNFKFRVVINGKAVAGVSKVSGLKGSTEVVKHREGGDKQSRGIAPAPSKFNTITLERGVTHDAQFEQWANGTTKTKNDPGTKDLNANVFAKSSPQEISIELYNEAGKLETTYKLNNCHIAEFQAIPDLDASANAITIQHIKLDYENLQLTHDPAK